MPKVTMQIEYTEEEIKKLIADDQGLELNSCEIIISKLDSNNYSVIVKGNSSDGKKPIGFVLKEAHPKERKCF